MFFFAQGNSYLFLYNKRQIKRTVFLPNGSWSNWENFTWLPIMLGYWEYSLLTNRYLVWQSHYHNETIKYPSGIMDLASLDPVNYCIDLPPHIIKRGYGGVAVRLYENNSTIPNFITTIISNQTITLWQLDSWDQNSWSLLGTAENIHDGSVQQRILTDVREF